MRAVAILGASFPAAFDLERMTAYDYLLVHTEQLGGPADLHPRGIIQSPASQVRRDIVQNALLLMMTRDLVSRVIDNDGIRYRAGETAALFLGSLQTNYALELQSRARWVVEHLAAYTNDEFRALMRQFFENWVVEFQAVEQSLGADL